jgi:hypothetical protein
MNGPSLPTLRILAAIVLAAAGGAAIVFVALWRRERAALRAWLYAVVPGGRIRSREDLVALKRKLSDAIHYDPAHMHDPRPLLRAGAVRTLAEGRGFCGENARVALSLLRLGGVPAHRLYLQGARWGHVVVEHRWDGAWRLFDAHNDPRTALPDEGVGRIDTDALDRFPNRVADNPWLSSYRIPGLGRKQWGARIRPPAAVTEIGESPALMGAVACAVLGAIAGVVLLLL